MKPKSGLILISCGVLLTGTIALLGQVDSLIQASGSSSYTLTLGVGDLDYATQKYYFRGASGSSDDRGYLDCSAAEAQGSYLSLPAGSLIRAVPSSYSGSISDHRFEFTGLCVLDGVAPLPATITLNGFNAAGEKSSVASSFALGTLYSVPVGYRSSWSFSCNGELVFMRLAIRLTCLA